MQIHNFMMLHRNASSILPSKAWGSLADQVSPNFPILQDMPEIKRWDEGSKDIIAEMLTGSNADWAA